MAKLGVIVPTYNVERFIDETINSFLVQTNKDFKIYVIDDGSTDRSGEICKKYASENPELIEYHYQDNKGLGGARNAGIKLAKEEYVWMFDSDDFTTFKSVENIIKVLDDEKPDILLLRPTVYNHLTKDYYEWFDTKVCDDIFFKGSPQNIESDDRLLSIETNFSRCIISKKLIDKINFEFKEKIKWEDIFPHIQLFAYADKISYLKSVGTYFYRINSGGGQITSSKDNSRMEMINQFDDAIKLAKSLNWNKSQYVSFIALMNRFIMWSYWMLDEIYRKEYILAAHKLYKKLPKAYFRSYYKLDGVMYAMKRSYIFAFILRGPFYKILCKTKLISFVLKVIRKIRRR